MFTVFTEDEMLRPSQASKILGVTPKTLKKYVRKGVLPQHLVTSGGHARYLIADVEKLMMEFMKNKV